MSTAARHRRRRTPSRTGDAAVRARITRALLLAVGLVFAIAAIVYNQWTLGVLTTGDFSEITRERIRTSEVVFAVAGLLFLLASEATRRASGLHHLAARPGTPLALLALLGLLVPLLLLDLGLRPFVEPKTGLFVRDPEVGWRLRPGARAEWGQVHVEINAKGLRGPEVSWAKPEGVFRVLYLGDSITFGYGLERVEDTYPAVVGSRLERRLGTRVETVNSGVGGWSPWQQLAYLRREGLRYDPDLIVVGFVLNDVTEKYELLTFGGTGEGWQLARTARSRLDGWLSQSALLSLAREGFAHLRFGRDVFLGAQRYEAAEIQWFAAHARDPNLAYAWQTTFSDLEHIFGLAAARGIPAALVIFPFAFQLEDPEATGAPQALLREFAKAREIPQLDLLPTLVAASATAPPRDPAASDDLFLDPSHLSVRGCRVAGAAIAEFLVARGLTAPRDRAGGTAPNPFREHQPP